MELGDNKEEVGELHPLDAEQLEGADRIETQFFEQNARASLVQLSRASGMSEIALSALLRDQKVSSDGEGMYGVSDVVKAIRADVIASKLLPA